MAPEGHSVLFPHPFPALLLLFVRAEDNFPRLSVIQAGGQWFFHPLVCVYKVFSSHL